MSEKPRIFLTGASRGIGYSAALKLLENKSRVYGTYNRTEFTGELAENDLFIPVQMDLSKSGQIIDQLNSTFKESEIPDVLVNNAGIFKDADFSINDSDWLQTWDLTMEVNLRSPALITKWFLNRWLEKETYGIVINISSRASYRGDTQEYAAYAASKGGLTAFTKSVARDFGKSGITAFTIAPGFIETDMARESIEIYGEDYLKQGLVFDELTQPEDVAELISFLASGKAKHMTGSTLHINGGSYMI